MEFILNKILSQAITTRDPSINHIREQFFIQSIHLTLKLLGLESQTKTKTQPKMSLKRYRNKKIINDQQPYKSLFINAVDRVAIENGLLDFTLREQISDLAAWAATKAFENFNLTEELMADLSAWGAFIANAKNKRMYGNVTMVGFELGLFLKNNNRFPQRSELNEKLAAIGKELPSNTLQGYLDYYEVTHFVRDNQIG